MGTYLKVRVLDKDGVDITNKGIWCESYTEDDGSVDHRPFGMKHYPVQHWLTPCEPVDDIPNAGATEGVPADYIPDNPDEWEGCYDTGWIHIQKLLDADYTVTFRCGYNIRTKVHRQETLREYLGPKYFMDLEEMKRIGGDRIVFHKD